MLDRLLASACVTLLLWTGLGDCANAQARKPTGIDVVEVPLVAWATSRDHALPDTLADFAETGQRLDQFRAFAEALATMDWRKAGELAAAVAYQLVAINEADAWFVVASDDSRTGRGPILVVGTRVQRDVLLEAPHVPFEPGTAEQAVTLLRDLRGRAALLSGAHRCASRSYTNCDGKTAVSGSLAAYRDSDAGHSTNSFFNVAHTVFADRWSSAIVVSLHGMKEDPGVTTQMIVSNGVRGEDKAVTPATQLRLALGRSLATPGTVVDCNYAPDEAFHYRKLCGFTNVQGRHVNGAWDACGRSVDHGTGRFVHVEQTWSILRAYAQNWHKLYAFDRAKAILDAFSEVMPSIVQP
jgi:hypothetical protein